MATSTPDQPRDRRFQLMRTRGTGFLAMYWSWYSPRNSRFK